MLHPSVDFFHTFLNTLYFQAPWNLVAMSSKCNYALSKEVLLFVCFKHHLIITPSATYSCILRNSEQSLPILLLHATLHLAGVLCSLSDFSYFSWKVLVPTYFFSRWKLSPIPSVAFLILAYLFWNNILQLDLRGWTCNGFINGQNTSFHTIV